MYLKKEHLIQIS